MTDANTLTPTDAEIDAIADQHKASRHGTVWPHAFARAVLAKWGARGPAGSDSEPLITIESSLRFRLACAKDDAAQLEIENRKLRERVSQLKAAPASQPVAVPVGPFPVASKSHGAWDGIEDVLAMPDGTDIYTASQVQAMLAHFLEKEAPRIDAAGLDAERHCCEHTLYLERERLHAAMAAAPSGPAREPLRCSCHTCWPISVADPASMFMRLCPCCGNKRCPKANDHRHDCTGSNEPGQPGSAYPPQGITAAQKGGQHGTE